MRELTLGEIDEISGGKWRFKLRINIGMLLGGMCAGFITMGPAGVGIALCTAVIAQGTNELDHMYDITGTQQ